MPVAVGVVERSEFFAGNYNLVEECSARVSRISNAAPDAGEPDLEGGAQRIRKQDSRFKLASQFFCCGKNRLARLDTDHFVNIPHPLPEACELLWAEDGHAGIGAAELEGSHGGNGHDGVAEPVWGTNDDAEGCGVGFVGRQVDASFGFIDEEIRQRGLPAVVNPEPVGRRDADLFFEGFVDVQGQLLGVFS